jgi:hypothetical protein
LQSKANCIHDVDDEVENFTQYKQLMRIKLSLLTTGLQFSCQLSCVTCVSAL